MNKKGFVGLPIILTAVFLLLATSGGVYYYKSKMKEEAKQKHQQVKVDLSEEKVATPSPSLKPVFSSKVQDSPIPSLSPMPKYFNLDFDGKIYKCPEDKASEINSQVEEHRAFTSQQESNTNQKKQCEEDFIKCYESCENKCDLTHLPQLDECYEGSCVSSCIDKYNWSTQLQSCEELSNVITLSEKYKIKEKLKRTLNDECIIN